MVRGRLSPPRAAEEEEGKVSDLTDHILRAVAAEQDAKRLRGALEQMAEYEYGGSHYQAMAVLKSVARAALAPEGKP